MVFLPQIAVSWGGSHDHTGCYQSVAVSLGEYTVEFKEWSDHGRQERVHFRVYTSVRCDQGHAMPVW